MLPGKTYTPDEIVSAIARRKWLILMPLAVGLAVAPAVAARIPELYKSETVITVRPQQVSSEYVKATVTGTVADRLASITDQIQSRHRLERIVTELDLFQQEREYEPMSDTINRMRGAIDVEPQRSDSFILSYQHGDPVVAQRVTARLAQLYIEENTNERTKISGRLTDGLEEELESAQKRLLEQEQRLAAYRSAHAGELPEQVSTNQQAITGAQMQLRDLADANRRDEERRLNVQRQIADLERTAGVGANAVLSPAAESALRMLDEARVQLEQDQLRYRPGHPTLRASERRVTDLQARFDEESKKPTPRNAMSAAERERQRRLEVLREDLELIERDITDRRAEERDVRATIAEYQARLNAMPRRDAELVNLTREYETLKEIYNNLLAKREGANLAQNLEDADIGEQLRVLDPASLPTAPFNQTKRLGLIAAGAVLGPLLGLLLIAFLEFRDSSFKREEDVIRVLSLPVLAMVPTLATTNERQAQQRRRTTTNVVGIAMMVAALLVLLLWRPIV